MHFKSNFLYILPFIAICFYSQPMTALVEPLRNSASDMSHDTMPSVAELFGSLTDEEIAQQVQATQELLQSLSPEELAEFTKFVDQTLETMPENELNEIYNIAQRVQNSPFLATETLELPTETVEEKPKESSKKNTTEKGTNSTQQLIDNINHQIDDILLKINSDKDLVQEFTINWSSKVTFDKLKRQILALKEDRLSKKLSTKSNTEDKELHEALEKFHKELIDGNHDFYVEDTFGLPSSNKKQIQKQLSQTKNLLSIFDAAIQNIMPKIEKFLKKHDPEALELAKESAERTKKAKELAKDATEKRNMNPAIPAPELIRKEKTSPTAPQTSGATKYQYNSPEYYDYNPGYANYYDYPAYANPYNTSSAGSVETPKKESAGKEESKKNANKADDAAENKKGKESKGRSAYDLIQDNLEDYFDDYNLKSHEAFLTFLEKELAAYPKADNERAYISNPDLQGSWINGTGYWEHDGFKPYSHKVNEGIQKYTDVLETMQKVVESIGEKINAMDDSGLKKIAENKSIGAMTARVKEYMKAFDKTYAIIKKQAENNLDTTKTFLSGDGNGGSLDTYRNLHAKLEDKLDSFKEVMVKTEKEIQKIYTKIKRQQGKIKRAAEKVKEQSINFY